MKLYLVFWLASSYNCHWGLGRLPEFAKRFVCTKTREIQHEVTSFQLVADRKVRSFGPGVPILYLELDKSKAKEVPVSWQSVLFLRGENDSSH